MAGSRVRYVLRVTVTVLFCLVLVAFSALQLRYGAALQGFIALPQASAYELDDASVVTQNGSSITAIVDYCSEVVATNDTQNSSGKTSTQVVFDNAWFSQDATVYNHNLATTCAVLSAVCNSESQFYGRVDGSVPYAEKALSSLGFSNIRTESYQLRSYILDQIAALFSGSHDVAAYAFASKTIPASLENPEQTLIFVGIRGSYGIEWLSNFKVFDSSGNSEHFGSKLAEREIMSALEQYMHDLDIDPQHSKVLITGHSRGGAIANLLAADIDRKSGTPDALVSAKNTYSYTFASPYSKQKSIGATQGYDNIFNIVNASDVVTQLPAPSSDFDRYGTTITLPRASDRTFTSSYQAMQTAYQHNTGYVNPCNKDELGKLDDIDANAAKATSSVGGLLSVEGMSFLAETISKVNVVSLGYTHYPDTYIAWMQGLDAHQVSVPGAARLLNLSAYHSPVNMSGEM